MKLALYFPGIEVTEDQLDKIADVYNGKQGSGERAKRDLAKEYIWKNGEGWALALADDWGELPAAEVIEAEEETEEAAADEDEDVLI